MTEQTVNSKVVNDILDHTKAYQGHYIQSIYKESLRSLINFFSNLYYQDGDGNNKPIKCYFGSQERSIAALFKENNLVLPVITVTENSSQNSDDRRRYAPVLINEKYWDPKEQRAVRLISLSPRPVDVSYTISIWAEYKEDLDQIREAIFNQFNPSIELEIEKNYNTKIHIESEDDTSRVSVSDKEDRVLRKTINLLSETYIPSPKFLYTSTGKIERFNYEIELVQTPQIFDQAVADQARGTLTIEEIVGRQQIPTTVGGGGTFTGSLATTDLTDVSDIPASATGFTLVWNEPSGIYEARRLSTFELTDQRIGFTEGGLLSDTLDQIQEDLANLNDEVNNLNFDGPYVNTSGDTMTGPLNIIFSGNNQQGLRIVASGLTSTQAFSVAVPYSPTNQRKAFGLLVIDETTARVQFELQDSRTGFFCGPGGDGASSVRDVGIYRSSDKSIRLGTGTSFTPRLTIVSGGCWNWNNYSISNVTRYWNYSS